MQRSSLQMFTHCSKQNKKKRFRGCPLTWASKSVRPASVCGRLQEWLHTEFAFEFKPSFVEGGCIKSYPLISLSVNRVRTCLENPWKPLNFRSLISRPWKYLKLILVLESPWATSAKRMSGLHMCSSSRFLVFLYLFWGLMAGAILMKNGRKKLGISHDCGKTTRI